MQAVNTSVGLVLTFEHTSLVTELGYGLPYEAFICLFVCFFFGIS
jgi:hypothetical protein